MQQQLTLSLKKSLTNSEFSIRRSDRAKRLRISISPVGDIEVVVPKRVSTTDVQHFIQAQKSWISRNKLRIESLRSSELNMAMPGCIKFPAVNESWEVSYHQELVKARIEEKRVTNSALLCLTFENRDHVGELLRKWLSEKAKRALLPWVKRTSEETGLDYSSARVRGQRTRWASCSARKNINLNRCMLFLGPEQVRYLMVHELCHTRHMNHSRKFWNLVEQFVPDYLHQERMVNAACYKLPKWAY